MGQPEWTILWGQCPEEDPCVMPEWRVCACTRVYKSSQKYLKLKQLELMGHQSPSNQGTL